MMGEGESTLHTRPSLLLRLRDAGDDGAWRAFVDTYAPLLYRWCRRQGLQDADAADISLETLVQVARCIRTFEYQPQRGRFRDWLGLVIRRRLIRFREQQGRQAAATGAEAREAVADLGAAPADPEWAAAFTAQVLAVALERIRPEFAPAAWQTFELTWVTGRPAAEAAAATGLSI